MCVEPKGRLRRRKEEEQVLMFVFLWHVGWGLFCWVDKTDIIID
jgi:hypothetical protein